MSQSREILAENATKYIKYCMMLRQQIISRGIDVKTGAAIPKIDYASYTEQYEILTKSITSINNSSKACFDNLNSLRSDLVQARQDFIKYYHKHVVISEKQVDELMEYLKKSILLVGVDSIGQYTAHSFLVNQLYRLIGHMNENGEDNTSEYKKITKWYNFLCSNNNVAIDYVLDNLFEYNPNKSYEDLLSIIDNKLLLLKNLYVGKICRKDENNQIRRGMTIVKESMKDGKRIMESIFEKNRYYSLEPSDKEEYLEYIESVEGLFNYMGLNALNSDIYDKENFIDNIIPMFSQYYLMSNDDKNQLNKVVEFIVNWWVNYICGIDTENVKNKKLYRFKEYFADELKVRLLFNPEEYIISIDETEEALYNSLLKSQIKIQEEISDKPVMVVTANEICLKDEYNDEEILLTTIGEIKKSERKSKFLFRKN